MGTIAGEGEIVSRHFRRRSARKMERRFTRQAKETGLAFEYVVRPATRGPYRFYVRRYRA